MRSKTFCCNGTLFKKNMARFAPLWLLYVLALLLAMTLIYVEDDNRFWFAQNIGEMIQYGSLINLIYAPVVAMLLFGDLYTSRMCNALHAMPLKRSGIFTTNIMTGLVFSLLPTAIFCGASIPLLMQTCVENAWQIGLLTFLGMNLSYLCFFGIAVFSALCVGNRFAMIAVYAVLNGGAYIAYFLVNTVYTPLLYGVLTPSGWAESLTPIAKLIEAACVEVENYGYFSNRLAQDASALATWESIPEGWLTQAVWAVVGALFTALGWLMYHKRKLECAGDTMATKAMEPVFQIVVSICGAAVLALFTSTLFGYYAVEKIHYLFLASGLLIGWFAARMLIERTVRVFRLKNWLGLAALAAVLAGSLVMTHYDVFGIESWVPGVEDVKSVNFGYSMYRGMTDELTEDADIAQVIRLQQLALEEPLEYSGSYVILNGERVRANEVDSDVRKHLDYAYATSVYIHYTLENGREVSREYIVWGDGETGVIVNEYLSRWEVVRRASYYEEAVATAMDSLENSGYTRLWINGVEVPEKYRGTAAVESLLEAIQADCEDRTMTQRETFHTGHFERIDEQGEEVAFRSFWIEFTTAFGKSGNISVFADSENTLNWLMERDLIDFTAHPENSYPG